MFVSSSNNYVKENTLDEVFISLMYIFKNRSGTRTQTETAVEPHISCLSFLSQCLCNVHTAFYDIVQVIVKP